MPKAIFYQTNWSIYGREYYIASLRKDTAEIAFSFVGLHQKPNGKWGVGFQKGKSPIQADLRSSDNWGDFQEKYIEGGPKKGLLPYDTWAAEGTFENPSGMLGQMAKMKDNGYSTKVSLSVGGWSYTKWFSDACMTETTRTDVCQSIIDIFKIHDFYKGINFDWEYPSNQGINLGDAQNISRVGDGDRFVLLCKKMREMLNANGMNDYTIAIACVAAPEKIDGHLPVKELNEYVDEFHIMSYDFASGAWGEPKSGHHCNLYDKPGVTKWSADKAVKHYLSYDVPSTKLFVGVALYSRGYGNSDGIMGGDYSGDAKYSGWEPGIAEYHHIKDGADLEGIGRVPPFGGTEIWDDDMKAHFAYDPVTKDLITYDTPESVCHKSNYVHKHNLGGLIIWESSNGGPNNLLHKECIEVAVGCTPKDEAEPEPEPDFGVHTEPEPEPVPEPEPEPVPEPEPEPEPVPAPLPPLPPLPPPDIEIEPILVNKPLPPPAPAPVVMPAPAQQAENNSWKYLLLGFISAGIANKNKIKLFGNDK